MSLRIGSAFGAAENSPDPGWGSRGPKAHGRARTRCRAHVGTASHRLHPAGNGLSQTEPRARARQVKATALVGDGDEDAVTVVTDGDACPVDPAVLAHVDECLMGRVSDRDIDVCRA